MTARQQEIILVIFGLIAAIILAEASLRLAGYIYKSYRIDAKKVSAREGKDTIKILCLGDSFTFGVGAPKGFSYPEQLQKMLDNYSAGKYIVYNEGIVGQNSSCVLKDLENNVYKYMPDIVIVLIGCNNSSNFVDSNYFLFKDKSLKTYLCRIDAFLSRMRSYKLFRSAIATVYSNIACKTDGCNKNKVFESQIDKNIRTDISEESKKKAAEHVEAARAYDAETKIDSAVNECKKAIELNPYDYNAYYMLGFIYLNRFQDPGKKPYTRLAIEMFKKSIQINPLDENSHEGLFNAYYRVEEKDKALEELKLIHGLNPDNEMVSALLTHGLPKYNDMDVFKMTLKYDLENIISLLASKNIRLILLNYTLNWPNDTLKEIVDRAKITFIDNEAVFRQKQAVDGYRREDYFAEDGHCNANGYKIMAENVYNELLKK